jgi:hypothetical protein
VEKRANPKLCAVSSSLLYSWVKYFRHESPCSNLPGTIALYREKHFFFVNKTLSFNTGKKETNMSLDDDQVDGVRLRL